MTRYYNINTEEISNKPVSNRTSGLWRYPDLMKAEGWYPIQDNDSGVKAYHNLSNPTHTFDEANEVVLKEHTKETKTVDDFREEVKEGLRLGAEARIMEKVDWFLQKYDPRTAANNNDIKLIVDEFKLRVEDADAATTLTALNNISNDFSGF